MAESLLNIKSRINTVKSIKKITNAMKLIASSRYTKLKSLFDDNTKYLDHMTKAMQICLKYANYENRNLPTCMTTNQSNKSLYIIISSTLGLCGGYFHNIEKIVDSILTKDGTQDAIFIGEKGYKHYKDSFNKVYSNYTDLLDNLSFENVNKFRHELDAIYRKEKYSSIYIISTKYINSMEVEAKMEKLFPLQVDQFTSKIDDDPSLQMEPIFEGGISKVADLIVPHYLDELLYRYILESSLSEQTSRKNSMENSTTSANQLIYDLGLLYNKVRQARITQEITEVISGSQDSLDLF